MDEPITTGSSADPTRRAVAASALMMAALPRLAWPRATTVRIGRTDYLSTLTDIEERILREALKRIGVRCEFVRLPLLRLIEMANDGEIDGDIGRIPEVAKRFPKLVMVPTPNCQTDVAVYSTAPGFVNFTRTAISRLRIGIVRGVFILEKYTRGMNLIVVQDFAALMNMLMEKRIDAAVAIYLDTEVQLRSKSIAGLSRWPYLWASEPLHCLLHERHAGLVPTLDASLARMTKEGLARRYYLEGLQSIGVTPLRPEQEAPA